MQSEVNSENSFSVFETLRSQRHLSVFFRSSILSETYNQASIIKWVDIEVEYFKILTDCKNGDETWNSTKIKEINAEFFFLKGKLIKYLEEVQQKSKNFEINDQLLSILGSELKWFDFDTSIKSTERFQAMKYFRDEAADQTQ